MLRSSASTNPLDLYQHKRRYLHTSTPEWETRLPRRADRLILFRYVDQRFDMPHESHRYWTELETGWTGFASEALGMPAASCKFRLEWHCPLEIAESYVHVGRPRMGRAGSFQEYLVSIDVQQDEMRWFEMNDWGLWPPE